MILTLKICFFSKRNLWFSDTRPNSTRHLLLFYNISPVKVWQHLSKIEDKNC